MAEPRIAIVLPPFCRYTDRGATSIDLYARDSVRFSRHADDITVIGPATDAPFGEGRAFIGLAPDARYRHRVLDAIRDSKADMVEVHQDINLAGWLSRRQKAPVLAYRHNVQKLPKGPIRRAFKRWEWGRIAGFGFVSGFLRDGFTGAFPEWADRAHVLYNGIDPAAWAAPLDGRPPVIAYVGRIVPEKGIGLLVEAGRVLLARYPGWSIHVLRGDPQGEDKATAAALADFAHRLPQQVRIEGPVSYAAVPGFLAGAAIAVVPSLWQEPFGRTAVEAMAAGCALVASTRGGLADIVRAEIALAVDPPTAAGLADAIARLIEDEAGRRALAAAGRADAAARFDVRHCVAAIDQMRRRLAERG